MGNWKKYAGLGLFAGLAGFLTGLFTAPKSGKELREDVKEKVEDIKEEVKEVVEDIKTELGEEPKQEDNNK
ncbi:MAG: YtxH domain-containing protein [Patescibacteria group bacterium]